MFIINKGEWRMKKIEDAVILRCDADWLQTIYGVRGKFVYIRLDGRKFNALKPGEGYVFLAVNGDGHTLIHGVAKFQGQEQLTVSETFEKYGDNCGAKTADDFNKLLKQIARNSNKPMPHLNTALCNLILDDLIILDKVGMEKMGRILGEDTLAKFYRSQNSVHRINNPKVVNKLLEVAELHKHQR